MERLKTMMASIGILSLLSIGLAGCGGVHAGQPSGNVNQVGGGLIGGVAGGILGSQIGGGSGKVAAIIGGTLAGAALGSYAGGYMDRADQQYLSHALETQPTGKTTAWRNPDNGHHYEVTPVRTYQVVEGRYCREFTTQVIIGGKVEEAYGTACRMPDGAWKIQEHRTDLDSGRHSRGAPACVIEEPCYRHGPPRSAPPPWAPAHGYPARHTYRYYPSHQVYYDIHRNIYFYSIGTHWRASRTPPVHTRVEQTVIITMRTDRPYVYHSEVRKRYPPAPAKNKGRGRR
jgi:surface antigen